MNRLTPSSNYDELLKLKKFQRIKTSKKNMQENHNCFAIFYLAIKFGWLLSNGTAKHLKLWKFILSLFKSRFRYRSFFFTQGLPPIHTYSPRLLSINSKFSELCTKSLARSMEAFMRCQAAVQLAKELPVGGGGGNGCMNVYISWLMAEKADFVILWLKIIELFAQHFTWLSRLHESMDFNTVNTFSLPKIMLFK